MSLIQIHHSDSSLHAVWCDKRPLPILWTVVENRATFHVQSQSKPLYHYCVVKCGPGYNCGCLGYHYSQTCRHITEVKRALATRKYWVRVVDPPSGQDCIVRATDLEVDPLRVQVNAHMCERELLV